MLLLPVSGCSLLVRTDFTSEDAWERVKGAATGENEDGFAARVVPVSDPGFDRAGWEVVRAAVPASDQGAAVLFIADSVTLVLPDHPVLVVDLRRDPARPPFRCVTAHLWAVDNNLNIANMDWDEFADAIAADSVFRGFA